MVFFRPTHIRYTALLTYVKSTINYTSDLLARGFTDAPGTLACTSRSARTPYPPPSVLAEALGPEIVLTEPNLRII